MLTAETLADPVELTRALVDVESVSGSNVRLVRDDAVEEVTRLKAEPGDPISVGGPGLAGSMIAAGLVDEFRLFVYPVILGGGTPYFPALDAPVELELAETRTFASKVVYLRHVRA